MHSIDAKRKMLGKQADDMKARMQRIRDREQQELMQKGHVRKKQRVQGPTTTTPDDKEFELQEYTSDTEAETKSEVSSMPDSVRRMLERYQDGAPIEDVSLDPAIDTEPDVPKIYYCSRTHSQLSQFIQEIRKTPFVDKVQTVSLGSRRNLCINAEVQKLKSVSSMNEECLDRQKAPKRCEFLQDQTAQNDFKDHVFAKIRDIEELAAIGQKLKVCPYYGTRASIKQSQIVTLPYSLLLQKSSREALGIDLKDKIILVDEAHNLISAITSIYGCVLSLHTIQRAKSQLNTYLEKFKNRLKGKNVMYIKQILAICDALERYLLNWKSGRKSKDDSMRMANAMLHELGIDHLNMYKIEQYLARSQVALKVSGYMDKLETMRVGRSNEVTRSTKSGTVPALQEIETFLLALTNNDADGRIFLLDEDGILQFKYVLLDPSKHFRQVVEEARSIVLAGGTMEPIEDFCLQLFPTVPRDRILKFSCGHIIPKENLLGLSIGKGPRGGDLTLTFDKRNDTELIDELGLIMANFSGMIPDGVVAFFPSYGYLDQVAARWRQTGVWSRISAKKRIFQEPRTGANVAERTLTEYTEEIERPRVNGAKMNGALLLSVVGGKMSEGINFSDHLGRGIIMVGLPFPNSQSPELKERMRYVDSVSPGTSQLYYENLCMRAVNQSIGRAIRHGKDYASIILLDSRYSSARIRSKVPGWIGESLRQETFGGAMKAVAGFFKGK